MVIDGHEDRGAMTRTGVCAWCSRAFTPRATGGKPQVFCRPACRRAFDAAGRRWVAEAVAGGTLTVEDLKNGSPATRALLPAATSHGPEGEAASQHLAPVAPRLQSAYTQQLVLERPMVQAIAARRR